MTTLPATRGFIVVDIESSSARPTLVQRDLARRLRAVVSQAFTDCLPAGADVATYYRGDGLLVVIPPEISPVILVASLIDRLGVGLRHDRRVHSEEARMRLRVAVHHGTAVRADGIDEWVGDDVNLAFRLVNADEVREALRTSPDADLVLVVSEWVFTRIVTEEYENLDPSAYREITFAAKGARLRAWVHLPGRRFAPAAGAEATDADAADADANEQDIARRLSRQRPWGGAGEAGARFEASPVRWHVTGGNVILGGQQGTVQAITTPHAPDADGRGSPA